MEIQTLSTEPKTLKIDKTTFLLKQKNGDTILNIPLI